ncbi:MAG: N-acetylmuramoyl-L-alanine amidase [Planctomycetota bacterium]|nr:N-acetylmuramoyl-L-alanine amidase [Planctomycetota bacterium]
MARILVTACVLGALVFSVACPPAAASEAHHLSTSQFGAQYGLTQQDDGIHILLSAGSLRLRLYPGTSTVHLGGREYQVKDRFERVGGTVMLSPRVQRFLGSQIQSWRTQERARTLASVTPRKPVPKLEPLPPRSQPARRPAPTRTPVTVQPTARTVRALPTAPASWTPPTRPRDWEWIVIHHSDDMSGSLAKYDDVHRNTNKWENGCGYHFVIGNGSLSGDGAVELSDRWHQQLQGAHTKVPDNRYNERGIGICLVGDFDEGGRQPTPAQMESLVQLIRWLQARYDVADADVRGHSNYCATQCPGRHFPWDELRARLR